MAIEWKKLAFYDEVATTFLNLPDTPEGYVLAGAYYKVNALTDAIEEGLVAGAPSGLATLDGDSKCAQDPKDHAALHQSLGDDELDLSGMKADTLAEKTADTGITADGVLLKDGEVTTDTIHEETAEAGVTIDTCVIKDGKAADSNLLEGSNKAAVQDHVPQSHALSEHTAATANLDLAGKQAIDHVIHTVIDEAAMLALTPLVGKMCWRTDELHPYVCTAVE